ncbi:DUF1293 domain-containing protein [Vibrio cholerae]|uniref:RstB-like integrase n=1 Tax=Vibrio phage VP24-2_Ke TaxID=2652757 RepID=A0A649YIQ4_9VIRU|nr:DUF1293 domain-containing protein [Vibrio cholerae]YP_010768544.1 RstB-like integrase [Vibrio phage VP24-2_Ke]EGS67005.1 hypothetical protein VCHC02A1_3670 [Vibrio cholerae HC-02A1]EKF9824896.1 DUF1293 domain-containing protein [Vibrio cholerae]EKG44027.1 hypothetical protein VCHC50A1_3787 [Vibrio cholerae HC-50A1]EKG62079.1 hypothetical protein VCHC52A1_3733 [Vibrio cholerae HC-52A1]EKG65563.1 hypothetical protein VCHC56A1_3750 [Vibrio cholerae HC-56A1]
MANITGIAVKTFPKSGTTIAELNILRPVETVNAEKFVQYGIGLNTDIPYNKQPLRIEVNYAKRLIETRAFVPNREYDIRFGNPDDDPLEVVVVELIPKDDDLKKYFTETLKK